LAGFLQNQKKGRGGTVFPTWVVARNEGYFARSQKHTCRWEKKKLFREKTQEGSHHVLKTGHRSGRGVYRRRKPSEKVERHENEGEEK